MQYIVKFIEGGEWRYLLSADLNHTTAFRAQARKWTRDTAQALTRRVRASGFQQARYGLVSANWEHAI